MPGLSSRVTILALGVSNYSDPHLPNLAGPEHDVINLKELLVNNHETALFEATQFIDVLDPEAGELRLILSEYFMSRSAEGDILIFYFSGHGVSIGRDDFGFCTTDTIIHPITRVVLPLSVVKFSEILSCINLSNVIPVFIIDACYSGIAGKALHIPPVEAISNMQQQLHSIAASSYALLCSCSQNQTSIDTSHGGVFSYYLVSVASTGLPSEEANKPLLTLNDIFPRLNEKVLGHTGETIPRLYIGATLPSFPFVINTQFTLRRYSLSPSLIHILEQLWNNGEDRDLGPDEISKLCGNSAYCNHNKLSFPPWRLVETVPKTRRRRLSERGRQFIQGNLQVPRTVVQDPRTGEVIPAENTNLIDYQFFSK